MTIQNVKQVQILVEVADEEIEEELELTGATIADPYYYYYDSHPTRKDLMSDSIPSLNNFLYLLNLLKWHYPAQSNFVGGNISIYQSPQIKEYPISPDVAVFKGIGLSEEEQQQTKSWRMMLTNRPAPQVVFEICSGETWHEDIDLDKKPREYGLMGVKEYYAYDPNQPRLWKDQKIGPRLLGWRYGEDKQAQRIEPDERGWLWSEELQSWVGEDGVYLRIYDQKGELRLTQAEDAERREAAARLEEAEARRREVAARQQEAEAKQAAAAARLEEAEARQREAEAKQNEAEARQGENTERSSKEIAWAKLRELGIDPESL